MTASTPLLATKFFLPPARAGLISRPRLVSTLGQALARPLTLISAPAGFGKTTIVSEWCALSDGRDKPLAWLSLDVDDDEPVRFLSLLLAALGTLPGQPGSMTAVLLQSPQPPPAREVMASLVNELAQPSPAGSPPSPWGAFTLALDDYHVINSPAIHDALGFLVDHLPARMHLLLLTRADPPLPLARMRARGELAEIRADDLRFTTAETQTLLRQAGINLAGASLAALGERIEGWIAGLQLAVLSIQGRQDPDASVEAFAGSNRFIMDYLLEEVLVQQAESIRAFLLQTSLLDRMCGSLCDALTGRADGAQTLVTLERANLFVVPLDDAGRWYRYHHLFADVLRARLQASHPDEVVALHQRAATWHESQGNAPEAFLHALAAGESDRAARLLEKQGLSMLMRSELTTFLKWLTAIEPREVSRRPLLDVYRAWALTLTQQVAGVDAILDSVERRIPPPAGDPEARDLHGHLQAIRAYLAGQRGEVEPAVRHSHAALGLLSESNGAVRSVVAMVLGGAAWQSGDLKAARQAYVEVWRTGLASGNISAAVGGLSSLGNVFMLQGQLHLSGDTYRRALEATRLPDGRHLPVAGGVHAGLSMIAYEWNDLATAITQASACIELSHRWGSVGSLVVGHITLAQARQASGDLGGAAETLRQAESLGLSAPLQPLSQQWIEACQAGLSLARGNLEAAVGWVEGCAEPAPGGVPYLRALELRTRLRILLARQDHATALDILGRHLPAAESVGLAGTVIELLTLKALALQGAGESSAALEPLASALERAQPEGFLRTFLDEGPPMAELLRRCGSKGLSPQYVARLLTEFDREPGSSPTPIQPLIEPLSNRELEVLRLLADGMSNQAIADRLVVSLGTVKSHTSSIYRKLDVASRTQALSRARDLRLL